MLAIAFGLISTIAVSVAVGGSNRDDFWLAAAIGVLCAIYPSLSLGLRLFVSDHSVSRDGNGRLGVEVVWMRQAAAGAFLDVLVTSIVGVVVLIFTGPVIEALPALIVLIVLSAVDAAVRYAVIRYRALR